jgi:hypothetical protein
VTKRNRRNPKFEWQSAFIEAGLTGNTGFIGLLMSTLDNGDGRGFFVSAARISTLTGLSERTVQERIRALREAGWIEQTKRGGHRGGRAMASSYALVIPAGAQPGVSRAQPEGPGAQPEASAVVLDQGPLDLTPLDPCSLKDGDELPTQAVKALDPKYRRRFFPSFDKENVMVYQGPVTVAPDRLQETIDTRPEWKQRGGWERTLRDEGLDENGEPLKRR